MNEAPQPPGSSGWGERAGWVGGSGWSSTGHVSIRPLRKKCPRETSSATGRTHRPARTHSFLSRGHPLPRLRGEAPPRDPRARTQREGRAPSRLPCSLHTAETWVCPGDTGLLPVCPSHTRAGVPSALGPTGQCARVRVRTHTHATAHAHTLSHTHIFCSGDY